MTKQNKRHGLIGVTMLFAIPLCAPAHAASCATQIDQVQSQLDAALDRHAKNAPFMKESSAAKMSRQPTPGSIANAEQKGGSWAGGDKAVAALGRARDAQAAGKSADCFKALGEAKKAIADK